MTIHDAAILTLAAHCPQKACVKCSQCVAEITCPYRLIRLAVFGGDKGMSQSSYDDIINRANKRVIKG